MRVAVLLLALTAALSIWPCAAAPRSLEPEYVRIANAADARLENAVVQELTPPQAMPPSGSCLVRGRVPSSAAPASSRGPGDRGGRAPWDPGLGSGVVSMLSMTAPSPLVDMALVAVAVTTYLRDLAGGGSVWGEQKPAPDGSTRLMGAS